MNKHVSLLTIGLTAAALSGCSAGSGGGTSRPATVQQIGNAQELGDVMSLLDQGQEKIARKKLAAMVKRDPNDARSRQLLDSISQDPVTVLGAANFDYRVRPGDTMESLAGHYLGDRLRFYLLSRYNGLARPDAIKPGQTIRIPGVAPKPSTTESLPGTPPAKAVSARPAPAPPAPKQIPDKPQTRVNPQQAARLRSAGLAALNKGQVTSAVGLLAQALSLDPGNAAIQRDLDRARRIQQTVSNRR